MLGFLSVLYLFNKLGIFQGDIYELLLWYISLSHNKDVLCEAFGTIDLCFFT